MSKLRIFLSSTCFDLAAIREDLRSHLIAIGHEPLLSEYPSFPVNPEVDSIANCRKNVCEHTDLLVLVVGGKRGYLDKRTGKSVTNLEYEAAREMGLPVFVFVRRSVQQLLSIWHKNQDADFTPEVDFPDVFRFLDKIYAENRWVFTFEKTGDVKEALTTQLSVMLRDLLSRSRAGTLQPFSEFLSVSPKAEQLAREKPKFWELLLSAELLSVRFADVRYRVNRIRNGSKHVTPQPVTGLEFIELVGTKCSELINWSEVCKSQFVHIHESWGPPGQPGDACAIKRSIDELIELCDHLVRWEEHLAGLTPPDGVLKLKSILQGWTEYALAKIETLPEKLLAAFASGEEPEGTIEFQLTFDSPPAEELTAELDRLRARPWLLAE